MNQEINNLIKAQVYKKDGFPATFIGQTITRLVRGRSKWKVPNLYVPTTEEPEYEKFRQDQEDFQMTELEAMYKEFCEKAYRYLVCHKTSQNEGIPHRIIFPHFYYEIIPTKFKVE